MAAAAGYNYISAIYLQVPNKLVKDLQSLENFLFSWCIQVL